MDRSNASNQLVIVAIPSVDDYVWKLSSEKVPHLTILYLGADEYSDTDIQMIAQHVQHAASLLSPFGLDVETRGELGDKHADVLFFNKQWSKKIEDFRAQLLKNNLIKKAYLSADQFPQWTPHLTMGYPESPAKKDTRDYTGISYVQFDRIALWVGDFDGPTFDLKYKDSGLTDMHDTTYADIGHSALENVLSHYGVKGMKWGVRRADSGSESASPASADHNSAVAAQNKINTGGTKSLSNQELQGLINRMNLERQYNTMAVQHRTEIDRGIQATQKLLKVGKTVEDVRKFMGTPTGKAVKKGLKGALQVAKVVAAGHTGGASAAASVGAEIAIRRMSNHYTNVGN